MRIHQERATFRTARPFSAVVAVLTAVATVAAAPQVVSDWLPVGSSQRGTISGMALVERTADSLQFLIVHDNKQPGEHRLALITIGSVFRYTPVPWPAGYALPVDLEAIAVVPGTSLLAVVTSGGTVSLLRRSGDRVELRGAFTLPRRPGIPAFEAFDVQMVGGVRLAVWGQRGAGTERGRLYWGSMQLDPPAIVDVSEAEIIVPYPPQDDPNTRHISDVKIDPVDGEVWITSASDPGDSGPFESAVYRLGRMVTSPDRTARFEQRTSLMPLHSVNRKLEALELIGDRLALATDDEHGGAAIAVYRR